MKLTKKERAIVLQLLADRGFTNFMDRLIKESKSDKAGETQVLAVKKGLIARDRKLFIKLLNEKDKRTKTVEKTL